MGLYAKARGSYVGAKRQLSGSSSAGDAGGNTRRVSGAPAGSAFRSILPPPYPGIRSATDEGPRAVPDLWADTALIVQEKAAERRPECLMDQESSMRANPE